MSNKLEKLRGCLRTNFLTIGTMAGVIGGVIFGLILRNCKETWSEREVMYVSYIGEIFLRMLKALILPLIVPSLITAVGSLDMSLSGSKSSIILQCLKEYQLTPAVGRVGGRAITYYLTTTMIAVVMGIILVVTIHPGVSGQEKVFHCV